MPYFYEIF
jgi:DNA-binding GntR family transcriptional regulator